jgi:hypothetical protein
VEGKGVPGMREQLERRLSELQDEQHKGQQMLAELEGKEAGLRQTLLRISGAIQVLEELLTAAEPTAANGSTPAEAARPGDALADAGTPPDVSSPGLSASGAEPISK